MRKHLDELLAHEGAASLVAEAVIRLDAGMQSRACSLIRCQLVAAPALTTLPGVLQLQAQLLEQLNRCFQVVSLGLPGLEKAATPVAPSASRLQVLLRTQLPPLLHLLLVMACGVGDGTDNRPAAAATAQQPSSSAEASSANASNLHSLHTWSSSMARELHLAARGSASSLGDAGGGSGNVQVAVLQYAAMLVGQLSSPDALYEMLRLDLAPEQPHPGADSAAEAGRQQNMRKGGQPATAVAGRMTSQEARRVWCAQALAEVLLDALLTMPAVAAAVRRQVRCSVGGSQEQQEEEEACVSSAETGHQCDEVGRAAAALLALHWELSKLLAAMGLESRHLRQAPWSAQTCLRLLQVAAVQPQADQVQQRQDGSSRDKHCRLLADLRPAAAEPSAADGPLVQLLLPPAVLAHTLELVQQALKGISALPAGSDSWLEVVAERTAALHASCMRGLSDPHAVLASPLHTEAMAAAARLHELLTTCGSDNYGAVFVFADGAALSQAYTSFGGSKPQRDEGSSRKAKRQRQGAVAGAEASAGNPVAELLQLLLSPQDVTLTADAQQQQRQQQQQQQHQQHAKASGGKGIVRRLTAEPVQPQKRQQQGAATGLHQRIMAQPVTAPLLGTRTGDFGAGHPESESEWADVASKPGSEEGSREAEAGMAQGRVVMRSAADMTDEQREAMWAAYIADKEAMLEMMGVRVGRQLTPLKTWVPVN